MASITYIGMDVHTQNYTLCAYTMEGQKAFGRTTINPDIKELVKYLETLNKQQGGKAQFVCGYEAGCLGYTLYHELTAKGYQCVILAPTTIPSTVAEIKTDKRDAMKIVRCLAYGTYSPVYVPTDQDNGVKEYIRMRDDAQIMLKQTKQQINALCLRHGKIFDGNSRWMPKGTDTPRQFLDPERSEGISLSLAFLSVKIASALRDKLTRRFSAIMGRL